jgi:hypothetical protein
MGKSSPLFRVARHEHLGLCAYSDGHLCLISEVPAGWRVVDNRRESDRKFIGAPVYVEYFPFLQCNFRCRFCFFSESELSQRTGPDLVEEVTAGLLDYCYRHGVYEIYLLGNLCIS